MSKATKSLTLGLIILVMSELCRAQTKVDYFLETRIGTSRESRAVKWGGKDDKPIVYTFAPGDIVRLQISEESYIEQLHNEHQDKGAWLSSGEHYFYNSWRTFREVNMAEQPVALTLNVPDNQQVVTVFSQPGHLSWKVCQTQPEFCIAWPDRNSQITLLDTQFVKNGERWHLFYKIAYKYTAQNQSLREGQGWVPSRSLKRKIGNRPFYMGLAGTNNVHEELSPVVSKAKVEKIITQIEDKTLDQLTMFANNKEDLGKKISRWQKPVLANEKRGLASENTEPRVMSNLQLKIDLELYAGVNSLSLQRTGNQNLENSQIGAYAGFAGIAPILLDLEAGGSLTFFMAPSSKSNEVKPVNHVRFEQYLVGQMPGIANSKALRVGVGWHVLGLSSDVYGYSALLGAELVALLDDWKYFGYAKMGPVGNTEGFSTRNMEFLLGGGWRLNPQKGYESWALTADVSKSDFYGKKTGDTTQTLSTSLGLRKNF